MNKTVFASLVVLVVPSLLACSWQAPETAPSPVSLPEKTTSYPRDERAKARPHELAAQRAAGQVGVPYRYGGREPSGFDCSGLVWYAYQGAGVTTPRTTRELFRKLKRVATAQMRIGDVLFFDIDGKPSHVGLYLGDGTFVHAPSTGKSVTILPIDHSYYRKRLIAVGRP